MGKGLDRCFLKEDPQMTKIYVIKWSESLGKEN